MLRKKEFQREKGYGTVYFIGAGPGDPELLTLKGKRILEKADVIIYAGSLINPQVLNYKNPTSISYDSSSMILKEIIAIISREVKKGKIVARLHSGDPSLYGALHEQMRQLEKKGIPFEIIPGVSSVFAASAVLKKELTVPDLSQTVILTRVSGRTRVPSRESIERLASSQSTMVIFLSVSQVQKVVEQLLTSYPPETPVAVIYKASWPDEKVVTGTLASIAEEVRWRGIKRQALILVGRVLGDCSGGLRSKLYHEGFTHSFRKASSRKEGCAIVVLTEKGALLGLRLKRNLPRARLYLPEKLDICGRGVIPYACNLRTLCGELFYRYEQLIFIMATGIVVRIISPLLSHKSTDPAVVVVDEKGTFAISLVSGHLGGANELAMRVASLIGGEPVITTTSDVYQTVAFDLLAKKLGCVSVNLNVLKKCTSALLQGEKVGVYPVLPSLKLRFGMGNTLSFYRSLQGILYSDCSYKVVISNRRVEEELGLEKGERGNIIVLHPRNLVVGVGCNRGTSLKTIENAVKYFFDQWGLCFDSICKVASVTAKANERGLLSFARKHGLEMEFFTPSQLREVICPSLCSRKTLEIAGTGVCEPAALLGAGAKKLLFMKEKTPEVTVAVAEIPLRRYLDESR